MRRGLLLLLLCVFLAGCSGGREKNKNKDQDRPKSAAL